MSETELGALAEGWISDAKQFDESDLSETRTNAILFYDGKVDVPAQPGRSSVVSSDVADVHGWILPGILRVFTASDKIAIYEPETPEDEEGAKQATDCINYIFMNECEGFKVIKDSAHDGLLHGNGPIKCWFEAAPEYKVETLRGLSEMDLEALISEAGVKVMELTEYPVGPNGDPIDEEEDPIDEEEGSVDDAY
jgi:hypothetical protein